MLTLGAAGAGGSMTLLIFVVIMFVGMYFLSIRPQKKQQQKRQEMLKSMNKGDNVVTLGGLKGKVASINRESKEVVVDCDGIFLTFDLNFIRRATPGADKAEAKPAATEAKDEKVEAPKAEEKTEAKEDTTKEAPKTEETKTDDAAKDDTKEETK